MRLLVFLLATFAVLGLAACGDDDEDVPSDPTPAPSEAGPTPVVEVDTSISEFQTPPPESGFTPTLAAWRLATEPADGTLEIIAPIGNSCDYFDRIEVQESPADVTITVHTAADGEASACEDYLWWARATITLVEPLGERTLSGCSPQVQFSYFEEEIANDDCASAIEDEMS